MHFVLLCPATLALCSACQPCVRGLLTLTSSPLPQTHAGTILTKSSLNAEESVELGQLVMTQNKKPLLDNWWKVCAGWPLGWLGWGGEGVCDGVM